MADCEEENCNYEQQKKKSGKRKIEIKPITNKPSKQVTFSKRRPGLFKKASELCSLCGAEVAVITFSGAGKLYSFGHPSADDVVYRYTNLSDHQSNNPSNNFGNVGKISAQYKEVLSSINLEKKKVTDVVVGSSSSNGSSPCGNSTINCNNNDKLGFWWDLPIDEKMGLNELEQLKIALEGLRVEVTTKIDEINRNCSSSLTTVFAAGNNNNNNTDFGSSDGGNSNIVAVDSGFEDCDNWGIPSLDPIMLNSLLGHNNASGNFEIFQ